MNLGGTLWILDAEAIPKEARGEKRASNDTAGLKLSFAGRMIPH